MKEVDYGLHETARTDVSSEEQHSDNASTGRRLAYRSTL